ncbi:killer cell lectin-like receptor subfamily E member 1 isoform X4 [Mus musculus]|uniref:killer cell lectin-like receptor subfamily E member 1 isoform X4 n=1 Tax=Mus musculus TaxID=10090 RepID=UPI0003D789BC|nr:killer cell lectin-like receptor subfamily E member 1 isoform X4 [Mus musculus]
MVTFRYNNFHRKASLEPESQTSDGILMDEAPVTRSTLNVNSQQKSKAKNKIKNTLNSNELSSIEQRKKYQKHLKKHKNTAEDISGKGNCSPPWRLLSSVLGAMCLLLMAVAMVMTTFTTKSSSERSSSTIQQEEYFFSVASGQASVWSK